MSYEALGTYHHTEKITTFAREMKKSSHILLSILLSMMILFIGGGVDVVQCSCTGMAKVVPCGMEVEDKGCTPNEGCLTVEHVHLSPTLTAQTITYDFHALQPVMAILPCLVAEWMQPTTCKALVQHVYMAVKSPPRDYLNLIQVLMI